MAALGTFDFVLPQGETSAAHVASRPTIWGTSLIEHSHDWEGFLGACSKHPAQRFMRREAEQTSLVAVAIPEYPDQSDYATI